MKNASENVRYNKAVQKPKEKLKKERNKQREREKERRKKVNEGEYSTRCPESFDNRRPPNAPKIIQNYVRPHCLSVCRSVGLFICVLLSLLLVQKFNNFTDLQ